MNLFTSSDPGVSGTATMADSLNESGRAVSEKSQKIIILGHSGFIGSHLERLLVSSTGHEVVGRSLPDMDLTDREQAARLIPFMSPDSTLILAAAVKRQFGDSLADFRQNMAMVENVCDLLAQYPVKRVIFMSSTAVYGEETENLAISEQTAVNPTSYYGINKYTAERLLKKTCFERISLVCLRPPLAYGPDDAGRTYGPAGFVAAVKEGQPITLWGDGREWREFIYVEDLCRLIAHLVGGEFEGDLNVVSGTPYCFADIVDVLRTHVPTLAVQARPRSRQKADHVFDARRIRALLPHDFAFTPLQAGLARMLKQS
jgi:UDP-glucose 4-epimerase